MPTRELAVQNEAVVRRIGSFSTVTVLASSSSDNVRSTATQITEMVPSQCYAVDGNADDVQVIVSTIGTLQRWRQLGILPFKDLKVVVFDEADVMVERDEFGDHSLMMMLMIDREATLPQILLFSATYNEKVRVYVETLFTTFKRPGVRKVRDYIHITIVMTGICVDLRS